MHAPYPRINVFFAALILLMFLYCLFYPVLAEKGMVLQSACRHLPDVYCKSKGLTRAFSAIMRRDLPTATGLNKYAPQIFTFFLAQLFLRGVFTALYLKTKQRTIIRADIIFSAAYFIITFLPLALS